MIEPNTPPLPSPLPRISRLRLGEIIVCLKSGLDDFRAAPMFGLFFSGVYVLAGFALIWLGAGALTWTLVVSLGFPLAAPFAAVGLYEVSRRREADLPLAWRSILGVIWDERKRQIPWAGAIILIYFLFYTFLAHMIFALFMGTVTLTNTSTSLESFLTPNGLTMIAVEIAIGGVLAFILFAMTAVSLPLLLDREVDFVSAMLLSMQAVFANLPQMLVWASVIAVLTFLALLPWFLGLFVALPVLGHATWHLYRRVLTDEAVGSS